MKTKMVRVHDAETGKNYRMPASELAPGMIRTITVDNEGNRIPGTIWHDAKTLKVSTELLHPPFDEPLSCCLREIKRALDEVHPLSLEEWENGFRCDAHPEREIKIWLYIAGAYRYFTEGKALDLTQKKDTFKLLLYISMNGPRHVLRTCTFRSISTKKAKRMIEELGSGKILPIIVEGFND